MSSITPIGLDALRDDLEIVYVDMQEDHVAILYHEPVMLFMSPVASFFLEILFYPRRHVAAHCE